MTVTTSVTTDLAAVQQGRRYHTSTATIADALEAIAARLRRMDVPISETLLIVAMQVHEGPVARGTVDHLHGLFHPSRPEYNRYTGHYGTPTADVTSLRNGCWLNVYGAMAPPAELLHQAEEEAYAEKAVRETALPVRVAGATLLFDPVPEPPVTCDDEPVFAPDLLAEMDGIAFDVTDEADCVLADIDQVLAEERDNRPALPGTRKVGAQVDTSASFAVPVETRAGVR
jgi:hypothetical protein